MKRLVMSIMNDSKFERDAVEESFADEMSRI